MSDKTYNELSAYYETLKHIKKELKKNKPFEFKNIIEYEENDFTKEKIRVCVFICGRRMTACFDIYTQYKIWSGYEWLIVKLDREKIIEDAKKIIKEVEEEENE